MGCRVIRYLLVGNDLSGSIYDAAQPNNNSKQEEQMQTIFASTFPP